MSALSQITNQDQLSLQELHPLGLNANEIKLLHDLFAPLWPDLFLAGVQAVAFFYSRYLEVIYGPEPDWLSRLTCHGGDLGEIDLSEALPDLHQHLLLLRPQLHPLARRLTRDFRKPSYLDILITPAAAIARDRLGGYTSSYALTPPSSRRHVPTSGLSRSRLRSPPKSWPGRKRVRSSPSAATIAAPLFSPSHRPPGHTLHKASTSWPRLPASLGLSTRSITAARMAWTW